MPRTSSNSASVEHTAGPAPAAALAIENIRFNYGRKRALDDVSFTLTAGERLMLLGANGAGKSTLFALICGLFAADAGQIRIDGQRLLQGAGALAPLGIVFQSQTLDLDLTVEQNLMYFCALHGIGRRLAKQRMAEALQRLEMQDRRQDKVRTLNGGHRRRVEIARATLHAPRILLLDEPTVGLDIPTRHQLIAHIRDLSDSLNCAVLWATHLIDEILPQDRVLLLHQGHVRADGRAGTLCAAQGVETLSELMQQVMTP